jgi:predicted RNA-binding Zn-ribbon protein involved in translation (DUF1610 family)
MLTIRPQPTKPAARKLARPVCRKCKTPLVKWNATTFVCPGCPLPITLATMKTAA